MVQTRHFEGDVVLNDGSTVYVREATEHDREALREFVHSLSIESITRRFFSPGIDRDAVVDKLIPKQGDFALVAIRNERIIAHACYYSTSEKNAEVSIVVHDNYQGKGLGTILLGQLVQAARRNGILVFEAIVQPENYRMLSMLKKLGYQTSLKAEPGMIRVRFTTPDMEKIEQVFDQLEARAAIAAVKSFLFPRSVAVIGASRDRRSIGGELFWNIIESGFKGAVYPVNSNADYVQSVVAYKSVLDCPGPVDLAVICVPASSVIQVAKECAQKGVKGLVVISAGFAESGPEGAALQQQLVTVCRESGMRLIGPNCMGIINTNPLVSLNAQFSPYKPIHGRIGFLSQSGALGIAVIEHATRLGLGLSNFVSVGNKADISGNDLIQFWEGDEDTDVILLYLESFGNPRKFARIARRVTKKKPIIAVKGGRSSAGFRAAQSHTGALLAASDVTVDALFAQSGVIRVDVLSEMFDVAALLSSQPIPRGNRVGIVTNAGGAGILASDACENYGLQVPEFSQDTQKELKSFLRKEAGVRNPVDMIASATPEDYAKAIRAVAKDESIDSIIVIFIPPIAVKPEEVAEVIIKEAINPNPKKPILSVFMATHGISEILTRDNIKIPSYPFPEAAARALSRAVQYGKWRSLPEGKKRIYEDTRREEAAYIISKALASGQGWLTPEQTQKVLECYCIPAVRTITLQDKQGLKEAAEELGGSVVLKAVSKSIIHKTELGAVRLNLTPDTILQAAAEMEKRLTSMGIQIEGYAVQQMVKDAVEMFVGVTHDRMFGPVVACGAGGVLIELLKDVSVRIAPLTEQDAENMLTSLKTYPLLTGYRGSKKYDVAGLKDIILRVSSMVEDLAEIAELDLNPVMVLPEGALVVDSRIRVAVTDMPLPLGAKRR